MAYRGIDGKFASNGFDWERIREKLNKENWYWDKDGMSWHRRVWLGTTIGITPSGKIYTPFACSNVTEREARVDEEWNEDMERSAEKIGAYLYWDDDSAFIAESKDVLEVGDRYETDKYFGTIESEEEAEEMNESMLEEA